MSVRGAGAQAGDGSWQFGSGHGNQMGKVIGTALVIFVFRAVPLPGPDKQVFLNAARLNEAEQAFFDRFCQ